MKPIRVYVDPSVFGGAFDEAFKEASLAFFDRVRRGRFRLVVSSVVRDEVLEAPERVSAFFLDISSGADIVDLSSEALSLCQAYVKAGVVGPNHKLDAFHVALATVSECEILVSWNFKHIVNFRRVPLYNAIRVAHGYRPISIWSPQEVIYDEKDFKKDAGF